MREEQQEREYRRGFCGGWLQAIQALLDQVPPGVLAQDVSAELGKAYGRCFGHWQRALHRWASGDCSRLILPPELEPPELGDDNGGDLDGLSGKLDAELEGTYA
jgi:hypothetical protein